MVVIVVCPARRAKNKVFRAPPDIFQFGRLASMLRQLFLPACKPMIHPDTELRFINDEVGYGVFATRLIPRGTLVWTLCLFDRIFPRAEAQALPSGLQNVLHKYAYVDLHANFVLCWDGGRYVNHSCDPAMLGVDVGFEIALRDLQPGDEITCEYGSLNLVNPLACRCGAPNCRGTISGTDAHEYWRIWDQKVSEALKYAAHVPQPLLAYARDATAFTDIVSGRKAVPSFRGHYDAMETAEARLQDIA